MENSRSLAILPTLPIRTTSSGRAVLTTKFLDGITKYLEYWDGPITIFAEQSFEPTSNLDEVEIDPLKLPFQLVLTSFADPQLAQFLEGHQLVLGAVHFHQNHIGTLCRKIGVPCVYIAEYSVRTRYQVVRANMRNPLIALRRYWWEYNQERRHRAAIRLAAGIQCNGTPTFDDYRSINPNPILYFDTRVTEDMLASETELAARTEGVRQDGPLHLLFSGRLIPIKGAQHLIRVAAELRRQGVRFEMKICGGGELETQMRADIERLQTRGSRYFNRRT